MNGKQMVKKLRQKYIDKRNENNKFVSENNFDPQLSVNFKGDVVKIVDKLLRLQRYRLSTDNNLNSLREVRVRSQEFAFWELEESLNNEN